MQALAGLVAGLVFGIGLIVSGMINPSKILAFLDVAGEWDATLALVMAAAVIVTFVGYRIARAIARPALAERFFMPSATNIDPRLLTGAVLFGIGWGLTGFCPAPAITAMSLGEPGTLVFVGSMLAGMFGAQAILRRKQAPKLTASRAG